jgi:hypothetical protein
MTTASLQLTSEQRKWILECYWKTKNVAEVHRCWRNEYGPPPPTQVIITRLRVRFLTDGTVQNVNKGQAGRARSSTDNESVATVLQAFTQSPKQHARQCSVRLASLKPGLIAVCG